MSLNLVRRLIKNTPLTAEDHDSNLDKLEAAIITAPVRGQISRTTAATVAIAAIGAYVTTGTAGTLDSGTASGIALGTTDTFALRNTSGAARLLHVLASVDVHAGNNKTVGLKLALNGTPLDATESRAFIGSSAADVRLAADWIVSVPVNGEVSVLLANHTEIAAIDFRRGRIVATEIS